VDAESEHREQLLATIAHSDAIIVGSEDSENPEVRLAVAVAYVGRARALGELRRYRECLEDCDRFLIRWSELFPDPTGRQRLRLLAVLGIKRDALRVVGRREESLLLGAEITERFSDDTDPQVRTLVGFGLVRRAETLLALPGGVAEALAVSDVLLARFDDEPAENLADFAELLLVHVRNLLEIYHSGPARLIAGLGAETLVNTGAVAAQSLVTAISSAVDIPRTEGLMTSLGRLAPRTLVRHRRRITQAIVVTDAVRARFADYDDPDLRALEAKARILAASATFVSGHPLAGGRSLNAFEATGDSGAVQAFADLAAPDARRPSTIGQIEAVAYLRMRAMALVGEDPKLARIAFDDSVEARLPAVPSPLVRLFVRLVRPSAS
jgi:hypothetical protein